MVAPVPKMIVLIIASAFFQAATSTPEDPDLKFLNDTVYAVTVSSQVRAGSLETLCAQLHDAKEAVILTITLVTESLNVTIVDEEPVPCSTDYYKCPTFLVPLVSSSEVATIHVLIKGESGTMMKETKVLVQPPAFINLIQSDKPIYKPGQTVRFRAVSLDAGFLPMNRTYTLVELQDPSGNRIAQWVDKTAEIGILDLFHPMSSEAAQGTYIITAETEDNIQISYSFEIKEYVLPKYEVTVHLPSVISILDEEVTMTICGKYTYGKPVIGGVKAVVCRKTYRYRWNNDKETDVCKTYELITSSKGCAIQVVNVTEFSLQNNNEFMVEAELKETATGVTLQGTGSARFTNDIRTVTFEEVPSSYKPRFKFEGKVKVVLPDGTPAINETVYVFAESGGKEAGQQQLTTDDKGMASFSLETYLWKDRVTLKARFTEEEEGFVPYDSTKPRYRSAFMSLTEFYSKSDSFVRLFQAEEPFHCCSEAVIHAEYTIPGKELTDMKAGQTFLNFYYLVTSRGGIVQHGKVPVKVERHCGNHGTFSVHLKKTVELTPYAQVVIYTILPTGEAVADSKDFPIDLCLKNKVSLQFQSEKALPGENTSLYLKAAPRSLCSIRAIDQSILLLKPENELNLKYVFNMLPVHKLSGYDYQVNDNEHYPCVPTVLVPEPPPILVEEPVEEVRPVEELGPVDPALAALRELLAHMEGNIFNIEDPAPRREKRSMIFPPYWPSEMSDVFGIFKAIGLKIVTNSDVRKPYDCDVHYYTREMEPPPLAMAFETAAGPSTTLKELKETVRTNFPETWIWDLEYVGDDGLLVLEKTVPDTITEWVAGAFCTSVTEGLGLAPSIGLIAFQPFFVSLTLPYSLIVGETFILKATVFNYLSECIMVKATLKDSDLYISQCNETVMQCVYTQCLCEEQSHTFNWIVTPMPPALGMLSLEVSAETLETEELCGNAIALQRERRSVPEKGYKDTVVRVLLVEAEGVPQTFTHNAFLCPKDGALTELVRLSTVLPVDFTEGSVKVFVSVLGDLMGRAMKNLDKLLAMPYGCGEQNMVKFAPNIYILGYLNATGQLTPEIRETAILFLQTGYQRELKYKHDDGSYSAFGKDDKSGNTWLTAFVMKSFAGAKPFIFVDPKHIDDALEWLGSNQNEEDGCISSVGKLFHNGMKGGVSDDISLTAYIAAAVLEAIPNINTPQKPKAIAGVSGCLKCLQQAVLAGEEELENKLNTYTIALLAYTFTLAAYPESDHTELYGTIESWEIKDTRLKLIDSLLNRSIVEDGLTHWERADGPVNALDSLAVEMTSFFTEKTGGVSDDISLTAYIAAAVLEAIPNINTPQKPKAIAGVSGCLKCLQQAVLAGEEELENKLNTYTIALLAYTFTLAAYPESDHTELYGTIESWEIKDTRLKLIDSLLNRSIVEDGLTHWERADGPVNALDSLAVEMTSYALLALLSGPTNPDFDLPGIVRWLALQQNSMGGFASTQDTVVALQALAMFARATYTPGGSVTVTVSTIPSVPLDLLAQFEVTERNRLLYQEQELSWYGRDLLIRAEGQGCVLVQIAMHYNIPPPEEVPSFNVSACVISNCNKTRPSVDVTVNVKYKGDRPETNMVIINIKLLSGYSVCEHQIAELMKKRLVKRVDIEEDHIQIYVERLEKKVLKTFKVVLKEKEDCTVMNLAPAVITVYDYYQPSDVASTDYITSCGESYAVNMLPQ